MSTTTGLSIPTHFRCPISLELMKDPVTAATGITYDRRSIETWLGMGNPICPVTNQPISEDQPDLIPNHAIRVMIQDWCVAHRSLGVDRIPTPRFPITQPEAVEVLSEIDALTKNSSRVRCLQTVAKVKALVKESERNKNCLRSNGAGLVLCKSFQSFSRATHDEAIDSEILEAILSVLVTMFPMDLASSSRMGSSESLRYLVWILKLGNLAGRLNAVLTVRELVRPAKNLFFPETNGLVEALLKLLREPISPQTTKAGLVSVFYLVSSNKNAATRFVELGIIDAVLEILVDCEKSTSEKCLGVLDGVCEYEEGREVALGHDLTVAVLAKKLFSVSDLATEFAASVLWKLLCKSKSSGSGRWRWCMEEALQVGAFQKLLLLLQVGCGAETKQKVSEMLRMLNSDRGRLECIETVDFKGLNRPF